MFVEHNCLIARKIPTFCAAGATAVTFRCSAGDAGFASILHIGDGKPPAQPTRNINTRPRAEHKAKVFRNIVIAELCNIFILLGESKELRSRMRTDNPQPHFQILTGEKIAGNMKPEHTRCIGRIKVPVKICFQIGKVFMSDTEIFCIGITDAGTKLFKAAGIAALFIAGGAGFSGTGFAAGQRKRRDRSHLYVAGADMHRKSIHFSWTVPHLADSRKKRPPVVE